MQHHQKLPSQQRPSENPLYTASLAADKSKVSRLKKVSVVKYLNHDYGFNLSLELGKKVSAYCSKFVKEAADKFKQNEYMPHISSGKRANLLESFYVFYTLLWVNVYNSDTLRSFRDEHTLDAIVLTENPIYLNLAAAKSEYANELKWFDTDISTSTMCSVFSKIRDELKQGEDLVVNETTIAKMFLSYIEFRLKGIDSLEKYKEAREAREQRRSRAAARNGSTTVSSYSDQNIQTHSTLFDSFIPSAPPTENVLHENNSFAAPRENKFQQYKPSAPPIESTIQQHKPVSAPTIFNPQTPKGIDKPGATDAIHYSSLPSNHNHAAHVHTRQAMFPNRENLGKGNAVKPLPKPLPKVPQQTQSVVNNKF